MLKFGNGQKCFLPVIHCTESARKTKEEIDKVAENGAHGVFLINHAGASARDVLDVARDIEGIPEGFFIGINLLGVPLATILDYLPPTVGGVWTDNGGVNDPSDPEDLAELDNLRGQWRNAIHFGGFAFKGQRQPENLQVATKLATQYLDVITTSGPGTARAANPARVAAIRQFAGNHPIALASGVTNENVQIYLPFVDAILCASGISQSWDTLDPKLVRQMADTIRHWDTA